MSSLNDTHILGLAYVPFLLCLDGLVFLGSGVTLCMSPQSLQVPVLSGGDMLRIQILSLLGLQMLTCKQCGVWTSHCGVLTLWRTWEISGPCLKSKASVVVGETDSKYTGRQPMGRLQVLTGQRC